jgi:hypothetical protein
MPDYTRKHQIADIQTVFGGSPIVAFDDCAEAIVVISRDRVYRCDIESDDDAMHFYSIPGNVLIKVPMT